MGVFISYVKKFELSYPWERREWHDQICTNHSAVNKVKIGRDYKGRKIVAII